MASTFMRRKKNGERRTDAISVGVKEAYVCFLLLFGVKFRSDNNNNRDMLALYQLSEKGD